MNLNLYRNKWAKQKNQAETSREQGVGMPNYKRT